MLPVMRDDVPDISKFSKPHLVIKLKRGWTYDASRGTFVNTRGTEFKPAPLLPEGVSILPVAPHLAQAKAESLTPPEREVARFYQVVFPEGEDPTRHQQAVSAWRSVAEASLPPKASPPGPC